MQYFEITEANGSVWFFYFFLAAYWLAREFVEKNEILKTPKGQKETLLCQL